MGQKSVGKRPMYVLMIDMVKSSAYSEILDDKSWEDIRSQFSKIVASCISKANKCYKEYSKPKEGDSALAYFMSAENAIETSLEMKRKWDSSKYNLQRTEEGKPKILVAMAIHYGVLSLTDEGPQGYILNLTSRLQKKASELARSSGESKITATKCVTADLKQESKIVRKIETLPLGKAQLKDLENTPGMWEIKLHSELSGKMPKKPMRVSIDERLIKKYLEKGHPLRVLLQVINVDILPNGNSFVTEKRFIKKSKENGKDEDEIYFGIYDSPDCKKDFSKDVFSLQIKDDSGKSLNAKWHESRGTVKRFGVFLGKTMVKDESMIIRADMFIPELFNMKADEEYFDLDIYDPTDKSVVKLIFPPGINVSKKVQFEYENGEKCNSPSLFHMKKDKIEDRLIITYVYEKPRIERTFYIRWRWSKKKR